MVGFYELERLCCAGERALLLVIGRMLLLLFFGYFLLEQPWRGNERNSLSLSVSLLLMRSIICLGRSRSRTTLFSAVSYHHRRRLMQLGQSSTERKRLPSLAFLRSIVFSLVRCLGAGAIAHSTLKNRNSLYRDNIVSKTRRHFAP